MEDHFLYPYEYGCILSFILQCVLASVNDIDSSFLSAVLHNIVLYHCSGDQSQPIHLHRQVHCCVIPSPRPYEDHSRPYIRIHFLRKRGSQSPCDSGYDHRSIGDDLVWQCLIQARWKGASQLLNA